MQPAGLGLEEGPNHFFFCCTVFPKMAKTYMRGIIISKGVSSIVNNFLAIILPVHFSFREAFRLLGLCIFFEELEEVY